MQFATMMHTMTEENNTNTPLFENLAEDQQDILLRHLDLVIAKNEVMNLTRIDDFESGKLLHIEDSLVALEEIEKAPSGELADIGSGAGYPGIPLCVATGRTTTLIETRKKKADALDEFIRELGLGNVASVYCGRAENLARIRSDAYSVVTARAVAQCSVLVELASPLLRKNGVLICYKAKVEKEELDNGKRVAGMCGMKLKSIRSLLLGEDKIQRSIVVFEKIGTPQVSLPRHEGMAQNKPL